MALVTHSTLQVETRDGLREIQLLFGDITCLPVQEQVDVIIVSAFAGDYSPTPTSVIGALKRRLGISVRDLARNKGEDLRQHFHCWWSQPLDSNLPYKQLMCFETPYSRSFKHPAELVSDVFRCLVPICKNEEKSVITPLLSTGDQCFSKTRMMRAMLEAAVNWMRAGLPLKTLKIVLYCRNPQRLSDEEQSVVKLFEKMRETVEEAKKQPKEEQDIIFDVYLSYSEKDEDRVNLIKRLLFKEKEDIRIFSDHQELNVESAWQQDIYNVMVQCRRFY